MDNELTPTDRVLAALSNCFFDTPTSADEEDEVIEEAMDYITLLDLRIKMQDKLIHILAEEDTPEKYFPKEVDRNLYIYAKKHTLI